MYLARTKHLAIKNRHSMNLFTRGVLVLFLFITITAKAQDIHYSQYYLSPLTLNPALTGDMDGTYRVGAIYRNQYGSVTIPYVTPSVFADFALFKGGKSKSFLGIGFLVLNDQAGDGDLENTTLMYSMAYHQALDEDGFWHLSIGLQGGYVFKTVNISALTFPQSWNSNTNQFDLQPGEYNLVGSDSYPDFAAGIAINGSPSRYSLFTAGVGVFHVTMPTETFMGSSNTIGMKYIGHVSGTIGVHNKLYIFPSALFIDQSPNMEFTAGSSFGINFSQQNGVIGTIFYIGAYDRVTGNDAIIPTIGFIIHGLQVGFAYDVNTSTLQAASGGQGAYEIGLIYTGNIKVHKPDQKYYCPHFY